MDYENVPNNIINQNITSNITYTSTNIDKKWKSCFIHLLIFTLLSIVLLLNYFSTKDNFRENQFIQMIPERICDVHIKEHNECLNINRNMTEPSEIINECVGANIRLQTCYDQVFFNRKCFVYMSEFEKCVRDKLGRNNKIDYLRAQCSEDIANIQICTSEYMTFDPFILLESLNKNINFIKENN
jgi:hypothetical protein